MGTEGAGLEGRMIVCPCSVCKLSEDNRCVKNTTEIFYSSASFVAEDL